MKKLSLALLAITLINPLKADERSFSGGGLAACVIGLAATLVAVNYLEDAPLTPERHNLTTAVAATGAGLSFAAATPLLMAGATGAVVGFAYNQARPNRRLSAALREAHRLSTHTLTTMFTALKENAAIITDVKRQDPREDYPLLKLKGELSRYLTALEKGYKNLNHLSAYPYFIDSHGNHFNFSLNKERIEGNLNRIKNLLADLKEDARYKEEQTRHHNEQELTIKAQRAAAEERKSRAAQQQAHNDTYREVRETIKDIFGQPTQPRFGL